MKRTVTIVGCGATGMAAAYCLSQKGVRVALCDTTERQKYLSDVSERGIQLCGKCEGNGAVQPEVITTDFQLAMLHSELILLCVSADRQEEMARACAPYLTAKHSMLLCPGNFGAMLLRPLVGPEVQLGELSDNLWPCRLVGPAKVLVALPTSHKRAAALPARDTPALLERWGTLLDLKAGKNVLETALNSPNVISHVAGAVLNTAAIQRAEGNFAFFEDGLSPAVIRVFAALEKERDQILEHLGMEAYSHTVPLQTALLEGDVPGFEVFRTLSGPETMEHRYISEDAQCGVALLISIAEEYGLSAAVNRAVLRIAECINDTNYLEIGRTLANYGLDGLTPEILQEQL